MAYDLGLEILMFQPLGILKVCPNPSAAKLLTVLERKFSVMQELALDCYWSVATFPCLHSAQTKRKDLLELGSGPKNASCALA
ncbi:MAG: hypothetical protein R2865_05920 [Deinococcales bacterium]